MLHPVEVARINLSVCCWFLWNKSSTEIKIAEVPWCWPWLKDYAEQQIHTYMLIGSPWKDNSLIYQVQMEVPHSLLSLILKIMNFIVVGISHPWIRRALKETSLPNSWRYYYTEYPEKEKQTNPHISYQKIPTGFDEYWQIPTVISLWGVGCCPCWGYQHLLYKFLVNNLLKWGTGKNDSHLVKDTLLVKKSFINSEKTNPKERLLYRRDT